MPVRLFPEEPPRKPRVLLCKTCSDTGLVELQKVPKATYAWECFFTMMPCHCEAGERHADQWPAGQAEYERDWFTLHPELKVTA